MTTEATPIIAPTTTDALAPGTRPLRVAFFSDALPERNGAGSYYHDLIGQLQQSLTEVAMYQPSRRMRLPLLSIPMPGDPTQKLLTPHVRRIWQDCTQQRPDLICAITPGPFGLLGLALARRLGVRFVSSFHTQFEELSRLYWDPISRRLANGYLTLSNRVICHASETVLVHNRGLIPTVRRLGARDVQVFGTPLPPHFVRDDWTPTQGPVQRLLFAGRLAPEKNVDQIVAAAAQLPDIHFDIAGDGPLRRKLQRQARGQRNIEFHGWIERPRLRELLDQTDALLLPSRLETFGTIALEAMVRGRPALVAENAGIHAWKDLAPGLICLRGDEDLARAIARLAARPLTERQNKSVLARHAALRLNDATISQWLDLIDSPCAT